MAILNTAQTSKLVCGFDVTPNVATSAGTAVINGPMYVGSPNPGPALVNITLPGVPTLSSVVSSGIALNVISPTIGVQITSPLAAKIQGIVDITGSVDVIGRVEVVGRLSVLDRITVGLSIECLKSVRVGASAEVAGGLFVGGQISNAWLTAQLASKKSFDINHPTKPKTHRLRYVCLEGPEAGVYLRGKIKESNIITLPDYFKDLVDIETIVVNLTPIGKYQELYVDDIRWGKQVIVKNNLGGSVHCHYTIFAERKDVDKNISEYEGTTPNDYPGDNSVYRIG